MKSRNDGLKIMLWTFGIFILVAFIAIKVEDYLGYNKPDLECYYWIENGQISIRKGGV